MEHLYNDKRLVQHYLNTGEYEKESYDKYLDSLKDEKDNVDLIDLDSLETDSEDNIES